MNQEVEKLSLEFIAEHAKKAPLSLQVVAEPIFANPLEFTRKCYDTLREYGEGVSQKIAQIQDSEVMYWFASRIKYLAGMFNDIKEMISSGDIVEPQAIQYLGTIHTELTILDEFSERYK